MRSAGLRRAEQRFRLHTAALALNRIKISEHKYICMCSHAAGAHSMNVCERLRICMHLRFSTRALSHSAMQEVVHYVSTI
jgi:hypothetical protein